MLYAAEKSIFLCSDLFGIVKLCIFKIFNNEDYILTEVKIRASENIEIAVSDIKYQVTRIALK